MEIREKCHSGRVWPEAFVRWRRRRDDTRCDSCLDDELTIRHIVIRLLKVSRLVFPIGRVTLTIALPAVAYIRGPSPSPIHEESTLFPTGLRSPILSSLLPFFSFLSFFLSFFLPYSSRVSRTASSTTASRPASVSTTSHYALFQVQSKSNCARPSAHPPTCQRAERELLFRNRDDPVTQLPSIQRLFPSIPSARSTSQWSVTRERYFRRVLGCLSSKYVRNCSMAFQTCELRVFFDAVWRSSTSAPAKKGYMYTYITYTWQRYSTCFKGQNLIVENFSKRFNDFG